MNAIKDNMEGDAQFSVYPGRRNIGDRSGKTTVRAPIVDLLLEDYEQGVSKLHGAFANARRNKEIRLKSIQLVPLRPSMTVPREVIRQGAKEQNKLNMRLKHRVVRGITNLDVKLKKKRTEETMTLSDYFEEQKYTLEGDGETKRIF